MPETQYTSLPIPARKRIALVAHDHKKQEMLEWATVHREILDRHELFATGTTGGLLETIGLKIQKLLSGPLGGDSRSAPKSHKAKSIS